MADLSTKPRARILKVCSSKKVQTAEKLILKRTDGNYRFNDEEEKGVVYIWGHRVGTNELTSVTVRL